ncbi:MAG: hypothetical protein C0518_04330 [Opitutus sp.]|nr:hypothetical protein [Opitutus sp.]
MNSSAASVYFVLGTPGSGRRAILHDLIENGLKPEDRVLVLLASSEAVDPADEKLATRANTEVRRWTATGAELLTDEQLPVDGHVFLVADSHADIVTQIESLKPWLVRHDAELARVITVVNCQFVEKNPPALAWFDACIHFSDVVFLTKREGVENKWLSSFIRRYEDQFYPCHFIQLKKGGIANPALVLEPQPRRVSQYFEDEEPLPADLVIETDDEEDEDEPDEDATPLEPYFERNRNGRRVKELPDIRKLYETQAPAG